MKKLIAVLLTTIMVFPSPIFTKFTKFTIVSATVMDSDVSGEIVVSCYETAMYKSFLETASKLFEENILVLVFESTDFRLYLK